MITWRPFLASVQHQWCCESSSFSIFRHISICWDILFSGRWRFFCTQLSRMLYPSGSSLWHPDQPESHLLLAKTFPRPTLGSVRGSTGWQASFGFSCGFYWGLIAKMLDVTPCHIVSSSTKKIFFVIVVLILLLLIKGYEYFFHLCKWLLRIQKK